MNGGAWNRGFVQENFSSRKRGGDLSIGVNNQCGVFLQPINPMKQEPSNPSKTQKQSSRPYIPVALGEMGRTIRSQMPRQTQQEMLDGARRVAQFRKEQAELKRGQKNPEPLHTKGSPMNFAILSPAEIILMQEHKQDLHPKARALLEANLKRIKQELEEQAARRKREQQRKIESAIVCLLVLTIGILLCWKRKRAALRP